MQLDTITNTLSLDQALSVKVLQLANSPFYGLSGRVRSIRDAINILGMRQLSSLVIAAALTLQFKAARPVLAHECVLAAFDWLRHRSPPTGQTHGPG